VINKKTETLSPGVYCNGLTIRESTVTLQPGTYFITRKSLKIEDSTVTGDGVLIVLADEDVALEWSSSVIDISAPTTGAYAGIAIFGHRGDEVDHVFDETVLHIDGVVYVPTGNIDWTNTGSAASTAQWTALIALGFNFHGDGTINLNFDLENPSVPYPAKLNVIPTGKLGLLE
jgi:hypothetical protein